jgi:hypothetical protein
MTGLHHAHLASASLAPQLSPIPAAEDTTPPTITAPGNQKLDASPPASGRAAYTIRASATDTVQITTPPECRTGGTVWALGTEYTFPIGGENANDGPGGGGVGEVCTVRHRACILRKGVPIPPPFAVRFWRVPYRTTSAL